ncbi:NUDIX domain-containing protein [Microbispora sp. NPDC004025]
MSDGITYTHPDVLTLGVRQGWADPQTDPTRIDWTARQATAAIPFEVIDGRPVNPCERTGIRYGRNELGHWGEALAADAIVTATDHDGHRWLVMVERRDGHGWALPGGHVDPGEDPVHAATRELHEETGLTGITSTWAALPPRYVPDPRASDEAWMVTVPVRTHLGTCQRDDLPEVVGADDAARAAWVGADTYNNLVTYLTDTFGGEVFPAHRGMLAEALALTCPASTSRGQR